MKTTQQAATEAAHRELAAIAEHVDTMIDRRAAPDRAKSFAELAAYAAGWCGALGELRGWLRARGV